MLLGLYILQILQINNALTSRRLHLATPEGHRHCHSQVTDRIKGGGWKGLSHCASNMITPVPLESRLWRRGCQQGSPAIMQFTSALSLLHTPLGAKHPNSQPEILVSLEP